MIYDYLSQPGKGQIFPLEKMVHLFIFSCSYKCFCIEITCFPLGAFKISKFLLFTLPVVRLLFDA